MFPVILIGGIPGVGKTSISGAVARKFNINIVLSGDYLREFMRPYGNPLIQDSVYNSYNHFGGKTEENIINGYEEQSKFMYKGINAILERSLGNGEPLILETLYFIPELIPPEIRKRIIMIYIYISDLKMHSSRLAERTNYTHFTSPGERLIEQLPVYRIMAEYSIRHFDDSVFFVDNINYPETEKKIMDYISFKINV